MSLDDEKLDKLIQRIYDAALDFTLWPALVRDIARTVHASDSILFGSPDVNSPHPFLISPFVNWDESAWNHYASYYWQHDVWKNHATEKGLTYRGSFFHGDRVIGRHEFGQSEIYNDFFRPMMDGVGVVISSILEEPLSEEASPIVLSFYRPFLAEAFSAQHEALILKLIPHLQRAFRIQYKLVEGQQIQQFREQILENIATAVLLLDGAGKILFANLRAEILLSQGHLGVKQGCLVSPIAHEIKAISCALNQARTGCGSTLKFENAPPIGRLIATFSPISTAKNVLLISAIRIMVMITEPDKPVHSDLGTFAALYHLTPAETRVLKQLLQQQSTREIAENLQISMSTLRTQMKALFAKTNTQNQRELIGFCLSHPMTG